MPGAKRCPGVVLTAGILLITYGGYDLVCSVCGAGVTAMNFGHFGQEQGAMMDIGAVDRGIAQEAPSYVPLQISQHVLNVVLGLAMIVSGIGALRLRPWARQLGSLCAAADMLAGVFYTVYNVIVVIPAADRAMAPQMQNLPPEAGRVASAFIWVQVCFAVFISFAFCVAILITLNVKTARDAFAGRLPEPPPADDDRRRDDRDDDDDDDDGCGLPPRPRGDTGFTRNPR